MPRTAAIGRTADARRCLCRQVDHPSAHSPALHVDPHLRPDFDPVDELLRHRVDELLVQRGKIGDDECVPFPRLDTRCRGSPAV